MSRDAVGPIGIEARHEEEWDVEWVVGSRGEEVDAVRGKVQGVSLN